MNLAIAKCYATADFYLAQLLEVEVENKSINLDVKTAKHKATTLYFVQRLEIGVENKLINLDVKTAKDIATTLYFTWVVFLQQGPVVRGTSIESSNT